MEKPERDHDNRYAPPHTPLEPIGYASVWFARVMPVAVVACGSVLLIVAALQVRVDRTHRRAVVTYVGPLAAWVEPLAIAGWAFTLAAAPLAADAGRKTVRGFFPPW